MASKMVTDRQKGADAVAAIAETQGTLLTESLGSVTSGEPLQASQLQALLDGLRQTVLTARDEMVQADAAHERELADDDPARDGRDQAVEALRAALIELREILTGLYGSKTSDAVMRGPVPYDPVVVARFAGEVAIQLRAVSLPAPRIAGAQLDVSEMAEGIDGRRAALEESLQAVAREAREAQATLDSKQRAIARYDQVFSGVATVYAGLFSLAGHDELADKVRPSVSRPGRTEAQRSAEDAAREEAAPSSS